MRGSLVDPIASIVYTLQAHACGRDGRRRERANVNRISEHASTLLALGNLEPERTDSR